MVKLGDVLRIKHGYAFEGTGITSENNGVVLVTPGNFQIGGGFQENNKKFFAKEYPEDYVLKSDDFIVTMTDLSKDSDTLGYSAKVPDSGKVYLHNQRIGLVDVFNPAADREYVYWFMRTRHYQRIVAGSASGVSVKHTSPAKIYEVPISLPPLPVQRRIAGILSAYDDLIENNRRRIAILEETARLAYRKWFVEFHFPGHEHVPLVDGIPLGWKRAHLGDCIATNQQSYRATGLPPEINYIDISSVKEGRILEKRRMLSQDAPGRARRKAQSGDVIWSNVRPNLKSYALILEPEENDVFSTGFTILTPRDIPYSFLYLLVSTDEFVAYLDNMVTGVTYPAVRPCDFEQAELILPHSGLLARFHTLFEPLFAQCAVLARQNAVLAAVRDMLLPRLMKGEVNL